MLCPYCLQGEIVEAKVKRTKEKIKICDECDTVWINDISNEKGISFDSFMQQRNCHSLWSELVLLE